MTKQTSGGIRVLNFPLRRLLGGGMPPNSSREVMAEGALLSMLNHLDS